MIENEFKSNEFQRICTKHELGVITTAEEHISNWKEVYLVLFSLFYKKAYNDMSNC